MKDSNRALRRHHTQRVKRKRKDYWSGDLDERRLGMVAHTPKPCSCSMCGNPRKYFEEKTVQEEKFAQVELSEMIFAFNEN